MYAFIFQTLSKSRIILRFLENNLCGNSDHYSTIYFSICDSANPRFDYCYTIEKIFCPNSHNF